MQNIHANVRAVNGAKEKPAMIVNADTRKPCDPGEIERIDVRSLNRKFFYFQLMAAGIILASMWRFLV